MNEWKFNTQVDAVQLKHSNELVIIAELIGCDSEQGLDRK